MKHQHDKGLDFVIDKLTNSIENTLTGEVFDTQISRITTAEAKQIKKAEWQFDWHKELKDKTKEIYKLTTVNNSTIIHGLLSIEDKQDHIFMHLIESAKFNKGTNKVYLGVPGNLVAFACKSSIDKGYAGFLAFDAKSVLIKHYEQSLHATHFRGLRMFIETSAALKLINQYFKSSIMGLIKEPKNVDMSTKSEPWTEQELSDFRKIMQDMKAKNARELKKSLLKKSNQPDKV